MNDYRTVIQVLRDHMGARFDASQEEGRAAIAERLRDVLGLDPSEAEATLDALIGAGMLRYIAPEASDLERSVPAEVQVGSVASAPGAGSGAPLVISGMMPHGYWEIGGDEFDTAPNVRKGQVRPPGL